MAVTTVLNLDEIKPLIGIPQLILEIEAGFALYSEGWVKVPPVGFLHFDEPSGDVHTSMAMYLVTNTKTPTCTSVSTRH
jgi:hypothetical protein